MLVRSALNKMCYKLVAVPFPNANWKAICTMQRAFCIGKNIWVKTDATAVTFCACLDCWDSLEQSSRKWYCCCHHPYMTTHSAESQATFFSFLLKVLDKILAPVKSSQNKNCRGPGMGPGFSHEQKKKNPVLPTQNASALCTLSKHPDLLYRFFFF